MYWKYNKRTRKTYDFHISNLNGVPTNMNAAFKHHNGYTYFFKGTGYYRFNDMTSSGYYYEYLSYPKPTSQWWLGCTRNEVDYTNGFKEYV